MTTLDDFLNEQLKDPEFRKEYEALQPEFEIKRAMIEARRDCGMTQKQLADKTGIAQSDISKLERGKSSNFVAIMTAPFCSDTLPDIPLLYPFLIAASSVFS